MDNIIEDVRKFVIDYVKEEADKYDENDIYPEEIITKLKEMGLFGLTIPKSYGGLQVPNLTYCDITEELAYGWASIPAFLNSHLVVAKLIEFHGSEHQKDVLYSMSKGENTAAILLTEPQAGSDLKSIQTQVGNRNGSRLLSGRKTLITNGRSANTYAVLAKDEEGLTIYLVPSDRKGISVGDNMRKMGIRGIETVDVYFENVSVTEDDQLGKPGRGLHTFLSGLTFGRISLSATSVGLARAAFDDALDYSMAREAYGKPISEMQSIQIHLTEMYTQIQAAKALTRQVANEENTSDREASAAKYFASEMVVDVSITALRVLGGYGYIRDYNIERYIRDSLMYLVGEGANDALKTSIAKRLINEAKS